MIYIKQYNKDDLNSRIRGLCVAILKQAIVDWRYDIKKLKGAVDENKLTLSQRGALKDMLNTINYIENGYSIDIIGMNKRIVKEKFLKITPKEIQQLLEWG